MNTLIINGVEYETELNSIGMAAIIYLAGIEIMPPPKTYIVENHQTNKLRTIDIVRLNPNEPTVIKIIEVSK